MNRTEVSALALMTLLTVGGTAQAQGPHVAGLAEAPPRNVAFHVGPFQFWPGLKIRELGVDSNVFDDAENPKSDWMIGLQPDVTIWGQAGYFRVSARSGTDLVYFAQYESERSVSAHGRVRVEGQFGLLRPWIGAATVGSAERPTPEIDLRARRRDQEYSGGLAFDATPTTSVFVAATRQSTTFAEDAIFRGVPLAAALDRESHLYGAGARFKLTPFTTLTARAEQDRDTFTNDPRRDSDGRTASVELSFSPEAVINGRVRVGYRDVEVAAADVEGYRGLVASAGLTSRFYLSRIDIEVNRRLQYSVDQDHAYFVESSADVNFVQRLFGPVDTQLRVGLGGLRYDRALMADAFNDTVRSVMTGVGYNFEDRSRFAVHFEYAERDSELETREYSRRRYFASYTQSF